MPKHAPTSRAYDGIPQKIYTISATVSCIEKSSIEEYCKRVGITQAQLIRDLIFRNIFGGENELEQVCAERAEPSA